jgi:DNA-binding transcriptional regulator YiaG
MEDFMNHETQELIEKAKKITLRTGTKKGTKYPKVLKKIVISLRLDHNLSVKEIAEYVGVSSYSAREWPKRFQNKNQFNRLSIVKDQNTIKLPKENFRNSSKEFKLMVFNQRVLIVLTALLIFESLAFHLIS